jgi:hypothetical protein
VTSHETIQFANLLLTQSGLKDLGWKFRINSNRSRLGVCRFRTRYIEISQYHLTSPATEIRNTILHEIAHALVGPQHGHGPVWKAKAREIGCTGERCGKMDAPSRYVGVCPKCNIEVKRNRLTEGLRAATHVSCGASRARGEFIKWTKVG